MVCVRSNPDQRGYSEREVTLAYRVRDASTCCLSEQQLYSDTQVALGHCRRLVIVLVTLGAEPRDMLR
jgi:hypothetical protein